MIEIWKDVTGYEGGYLISNFGRLKSLERKVKIKGGAYRNKAEKIINPKINVKGYNFHYLSLNGKKKGLYFHRLVAICFISNPENKIEVNHIDGNKSNNNVSNLEWCSKSENMIHSYKTGLHKPTRGSINGMAKLNDEKVLEIKKKYLFNDVRIKNLAIEYNVNGSCICNIVHGKRWKHVKTA